MGIAGSRTVFWSVIVGYVVLTTVKNNNDNNYFIMISLQQYLRTEIEINEIN